MSIGGRR